MWKAEVSRRPSPEPSLLDAISDWARLTPQAAAILSVQEQAWTFSRLVDNATRLRLELTDQGVTGATRLAVMMSDTPLFACALLAASTVCPCLPLSVAAREDEVVRLLELAKVDTVLLDALTLDTVGTYLVAQGFAVLGWRAESSVMRVGPRPSVSRAPLIQPGLLMPTSGTSGEPKLVPVPAAACLAGALTIARALALGPSDRCLNLTPLHHVSGQFMATFASWCAGASVILVEDPTRPDVLELHAACAPSWLCAVPATLRRLAETDSAHARSLNLAFIHTGAAALAAAFHTEVIQSYGMTETIMISCNPRGGARRPGTVGIPQQPTRVVGAEGRPAAVGEEGEVCVRGPSVFRGYVGEVESTGSRFTDGWFRTGDLGRFDGDGYLRITGRAKEMINRGGEKVSPLEVDAALESHPAVACAAAFAVPHPDLGEDVLAAVELRGGHCVSPDVLRAFVAARLATHKVPRRILVVTEIPKNRVGKKQRQLLALAHAPSSPSSLASPGNVDLEGKSIDERAARIEDLIVRIAVGLTGRGEWNRDDTFVAQGLDSVGLAELRRELEQVLVCPISATSLFMHPCARGLGAHLAARTVSRHEDRTAVQPMDRALSYNELNWLNVAERTGSCILVEGVRVRGPLTHQALVGALRALQKRHPMLQVHVEGAGWSRKFVTEGTTPIHVRAERMTEESVDAEVDRQINNRSFRAHGPLLDLTWLALEDRPNEHVLLTRASHTIWDGSNEFTRELLATLGSELRGEPCALSRLSALPSVDDLVGSTPRDQWPVRETVRLASCLARHRMPMFQISQAGSTARVSTALDRGTASALERRARSERTTTLSLATAALLRATREMMAGEGAMPLSVMTFVDLRQHYDPPVQAEQLGAHCTGLLHCHEVAREEPLLELARAAKDALTNDLARGVAIDMFGTQRRLFRLSTRFPVLAGKSRRTSTVLVSQVNSFGGLGLREGELEILDILCGGAVHGAGPSLCLYVVPFQGELRLVLVYPAQLFDPVAVRATLARIGDDLRALASTPNTQA